MSITFFTKNIFLIIIFNILINNSLSKKNSIILPFKTYYPYQFKEYSYLTHEQVIDSLMNLSFYSIFEIGNPPKEIPIIYNFYNSSLSLNSNLNFLFLQKTYYNPFNSKTFKILDNDNAQEEFIIETENSKIIKNLTFLYQSYDNITENIIGCLGLQNFYRENTNNNTQNTNFLYQLKELGIIDYISFSINYVSENEGFIDINIEPNEYSPKFYSNKNKCNSYIKRIKSNYTKVFEEYLWSIDIKSICYYNFEKKISLINDENNETTEEKYIALLMPQYGLIKGSNCYKNNIEKDFFNNFIENDICNNLKIGTKLFYLCKAENKTKIKEKFPTLYFYHLEFNYTFELNFDDLFYEKNNSLYFLIYFETEFNEENKFARISEWILGRPFLSKYQFSFDVEENKISFYEDIKGYNYKRYLFLKRNKNSYVNKLLPINNIIIISLIMFILFVSCFCISYYCQKENNNKPLKTIKIKKEKNKDKTKNVIEEQQTLESFN